MGLRIIEILQFSMQAHKIEINHANVPSSFCPNASKHSLLSQMYCYSEQQYTVCYNIKNACIVYVLCESL